MFPVLLLFLTACWPSSVSFRDAGAMDVRWKRFYVDALENNAPNSPLSYATTLAESIKDGVQNNTRLLLGSNKDSCQIQIEGSILRYDVAPAAIQQGDNAAKNRLTVSAKITIFINLPDSEENTATPNEMSLTSTRFVDYDAGLDFTSQESSLLEEINKQIVDDVVNKLMSNW